MTDKQQEEYMSQGAHQPSQWAGTLFGQARLGDERLTRRLVDMTTRLATYTGESMAAACRGDVIAQEGAYRFIRNDKIEPTRIRQAGFQATVNAAAEHEEMLAIGDTTSMSYRHGVADTLGKLGKASDKARGYWVHSSLLLETRLWRTVGLVGQDWWCRPDDPADADEKESGKWRDTSASLRRQLGPLMSRVIEVCDREADIFDYLQMKSGHEERFVVRAKHNRKVEGSTQDLFDHLRSLPALGGYQVDIPQKGYQDSKGKRKNRPARQARLEVRATRVTVTQGKTSLSLNAVLAEEAKSADGNESLCWLLLTSEPIECLPQALKVVEYYSHRWRVEDFHKCWKTGAGAERQRMEEAENLERMVSILAFVGVRLLQLQESVTLPQQLAARGLQEQAQAVATLKCNSVLSEDEWQLLYHLDRHRSKPQLDIKKEIPSLQWAYQALARLGGFTDTKRTGIAGWATLWKGWYQLQERLIGFLAAKEMARH